MPSLCLKRGCLHRKRAVAIAETGSWPHPSSATLVTPNSSGCGALRTRTPLRVKAPDTSSSGFCWKSPDNRCAAAGSGKLVSAAYILLYPALFKTVTASRTQDGCASEAETETALSLVAVIDEHGSGPGIPRGNCATVRWVLLGAHWHCGCNKLPGVVRSCCSYNFVIVTGKLSIRFVDNRTFYSKSRFSLSLNFFRWSGRGGGRSLHHDPSRVCGGLWVDHDARCPCRCQWSPRGLGPPVGHARFSQFTRLWSRNSS